jgi:hypothetical protein
MDIFNYFDSDFKFDDVSFDLENNIPVDDFEGYTRNEIDRVLYNIFEEISPVRIRKEIPDQILDRIPFLKLCEYLFHFVEKSGEVKLTRWGNLPVKLVKLLYEQKFIAEPFVEQGLRKLYKEDDSMAILLCHKILDFSGILKKRKNILSVNRNKTKSISNRSDFLRIIIQAFALRFNWASLDGYGDSRTGQFGFGYTLLLLNKYGNIFRSSQFYSDKYRYAFPLLLHDFAYHQIYESRNIEHDFTRCYTIRSFDRFFELFNLVEETFTGDYFLKQTINIRYSAIFHDVLEFDI